MLLIPSLWERRNDIIIFWKNMSFYEKLKALNIELLTVEAPAAAYVMYAQTGNTVFLSGHLAKKDGKVWVGQFGKNITPEEGKQAARSVAIDLMATLQMACCIASVQA